MATRAWIAGLVAATAVAAGLAVAAADSGQAGRSGAPTVATSPATGPVPKAAANAPNVFIYNLDDLRDAIPGNVDPLQFMPKVRQWMAQGTRYQHSFVAVPSCCPSRSVLMTGRYAHNNGVRLQAEAPAFDSGHSMACYLGQAGYATYLAGKFLNRWPLTQVPPCFQRSTVISGGYHDVQVSIDGVPGTAPGYSTTYLGVRGREYLTQALGGSAPFLLYEAPTAPHWVDVTNPDGSTTRRADPEPAYANAPVGTCSGPGEADRSDKPSYVRNTNHTAAQAQAMCASQLRAIMTADDQFGATMRLLSNRGALADTLVVFTSDNGFLWGEHGRTEKFVPYEPSVKVPLLVRWPGHLPAGQNGSRLVSNVDILPTLLDAAGVGLPVGAPAVDGESLLRPSGRGTAYAEYWRDSANGFVETWAMVRTRTVKYVHTYNSSGGVIFREYYDLTADPREQTNLLGDGTAANDPRASELSTLRNRLSALRACVGTGCVR